MFEGNSLIMKRSGIWEREREREREKAGKSKRCTDKNYEKWTWNSKKEKEYMLFTYSAMFLQYFCDQVIYNNNNREWEKEW